MIWCVPTWDARLWTKHVNALIREASWSRHLVSFTIREHASPETARAGFTALLEEYAADAILMLDADQAVEVLANPSTASVVDHVVAQYHENRTRRRILFGVTPIGYEQSDDAVNYRREEDGTIRWAGTGCMFIPAAAWSVVRAAHKHPWFPDAADHWDGTGEDIRMCRRAREAGIILEPIRGVRIAHDPLWRKPLVHEET